MMWKFGCQQDIYREISSVSNTEAFQARRARIQYRMKTVATICPHLKWIRFGRWSYSCCNLRNYQNQDGTVTIPEVCAHTLC